MLVELNLPPVSRLCQGSFGWPCPGAGGLPLRGLPFLECLLKDRGARPEPQPSMSPQNLHVSQPLGSGSLSGLVESCPAHAQHSVGLSRNLRVDFRSPLSVRARGSSHLSGLNRSLSCRPPARPSCCQAKALVSLASPQGPQSCAGFYTDSESSCFVCVQFYILLM